MVWIYSSSIRYLLLAIAFLLSTNPPALSHTRTMDQDYFDELFAEANDEAVVDEKAPLSVEPAKEEEDVDPLERSRRARKIVNEIFEGDDDKDKDEDEEVDEEYTNDSLPNEQLPKNRPKLIPTGSQSDDKILEARRDFEEALARMKPSRRRREGDSEETVKASEWVK